VHTAGCEDSEREVSEMYQIIALLGLMAFTWVVAIWASNIEVKQ
jgi:hypothetical protein